MTDCSTQSSTSNNPENLENSVNTFVSPISIRPRRFSKGRGLGRGGNGKIYKAYVEDNKVYALKVLRINNPKQLEKDNEVVILQQMSHKNIRRVSGISEKSRAIVLEYCEGRSLKSLIQQMPGISLEMRTKWAIDMAKAVYYLHNKKIIHCDIKAENILIKEKPCLYDSFCDSLSSIQICSTCDGTRIHFVTLKLSDFGLAMRLTSDVCESKDLKGTIPWMSPDAINQRYSTKSDVWSFGVFLWELFTGQEPYQGLNLCAVMYEIGSNNLKLETPANLPEEIKKILNICWEVDVEKRASIREVAYELAYFYRSLKNLENRTRNASSGYNSLEVLSSDHKCEEASKNHVETAMASSLAQNTQPPEHVCAMNHPENSIVKKSSLFKKYFSCWLFRK